MSLLPNSKRYIRPQTESVPQPPEPQPVQPFTVLDILERDESELNYQLGRIEEAKRLEPELRQRLNVVQQSLQAFRALEAASEPVQEQSAPAPIVKNVRKAATRKTARPTQSSIAQEPVVSDTENIALVHDDFSTFPE